MDPLRELLRPVDSPAPPKEGGPAVLMLGKGWFPTQLGGLDRYYRALLSELPEACGVVVGPADDVPARVSAVSSHEAPLVKRLIAVTRATWSAIGEVEIVDVHFALYGLLPTVIAKLRRKRLIVHFQGPWAAESLAMTGRSSWHIQVKFAVECTVYRQADLLITLTRAFRDLLVDTYGVDPAKVRVLGPGVDTSEFSPGCRDAARKRFDLATDAFVVCCVRRLVPRMGIDLLLEAWAAQLAANPAAVLLISGDGPLRKELQATITAADWGSRVKLLGRIPDDALVDLYRAADMNILPSRSHEGFGLTVLEAAACGTPSIVTNIGGLPEAVDGMGSNLVVEAGNSEVITARLADAHAGDLPSREETLAWALTKGWAATAEDHRSVYWLVLA
jgi:glycosyltransferase involved in cell wall biosynthesis